MKRFSLFLPPLYQLCGLVFVSGATGLIYEVVWHQYLHILFGAQAQATATILAIFLGGIGCGYYFFGKLTQGKNFQGIKIYAFIELGIGVWAFLFPWMFRALFPLIGRLYGVLGVENTGIDLVVSLLLLGIPTFLMGGSLPALTQSLSEDLKSSSRTHAMIYGWNTVGACVGGLLAGYFLIPKTTLPITLNLAGVCNVLIALIAYSLVDRQTPVVPTPSSRIESKPISWLFLGIAFLSGFYVLTLQNISVRLVGLTTGSSHYNFTLIISVFVFGLGVSSLLAKRISHYRFEHLFWNQVAVPCLFILLYLSVDYWAYGNHLLRITLRNIPQTFPIYQMVLAFCLGCILILPVGICGMTLPLCFHLIKDKKENLGQSVGKLYSINTVGCVFGALGGGYYLLQYFNLDQIFKLCIYLAALSAVLASVISARNSSNRKFLIFGNGIVLGVVAITFFVNGFAKEAFNQPFRISYLNDASFKGAESFRDYLFSKSRYLYYHDGPDATLAITETERNGKEPSRSVIINGKSDGNTEGDYFTMSMTGHLPALFSRRLNHSCVIGFGTGISAAAIASYSESNQIDIAELSGDLIRESSLFDSYNGGLSKNPAVHFHHMDAFRFLHGTKERFDLVVSEPSNPWVVGVENLFSKDFYERVHAKLTMDGVFAQWLQAYSFSDELFRTVLKTLTSEFPEVRVFQLRDYEYLLIASDKAFGYEDIQRAEKRIRDNEKARQLVVKSGITRFESLLALELFSAKTARSISAGGKIQKLESPKLSYGATVSFYSGELAEIPMMARGTKEFFVGAPDLMLSQFLKKRSLGNETPEEMEKTFCEIPVSKNQYLCSQVQLMAAWIGRPWAVVSEDERDLLRLFSGELGKGKFDLKDLLTTELMQDFYQKNASAMVKLPAEKILDRYDFCLSHVREQDGIYGDCLLGKTTVLELLPGDGKGFFDVAQKYLDWSEKTSAYFSRQPKFEEARKFLKQVIRNHSMSS